LGVTRVTVKVCRVDHPEKCQTVRDLVVDTHATATVLPSEVIAKLGIKPHSKRAFTIADGTSTEEKDVSSALIEIDGRKTSDDIIAVDKGIPLLSVRALEGLGMQVDPKTGKLSKSDTSLLL